MALRLAEAAEPLAVVILDGTHDLSYALAVRDPSVRYLRVSTHAYRHVALVSHRRRP